MKTLILCGGSGTRLWPLSRTSCPKQFSPLIENKSLFDMTLERNAQICDEFIIVVNQLQVEHCLKSLPASYRSQLVIEPAARNTAPALGLACMNLDPDEIVFVVPSDHLIAANEAYYKSVARAQELASQNFLVTFGIKATYPETGYGYIEAQGSDVLSFKEKPSLAMAQEYLKQGNYFWNSGMFCFKAGVFLAELKKYCPEVFSSIQKVYESKSTNKFGLSFDKDLMQQVPSISIDYAVMEKSESVKVVPAPIDWSDLGSFDSLYDQLKKDDKGNTSFDHLVAHNSENNLIIGNKRVIATFDVSDLVIIDTADALLIGKRGQTQNVKELVEKLKKIRPEVLD